MTFPITSNLGDYSSGDLPSDTGVQAGGGGPRGAIVRASGLVWSFPQAGGLAPAATGADIVVAIGTLPANAFEKAGRELLVEALGAFAANGNTKTAKIFVNPTTPVVGVAVAGGTLIASTAAVTTNGSSWRIGSLITKTYAANSNTQNAMQLLGQVGGASATPVNPQALTLPENAAITFAVTINAATTASDMTLWGFTAKWFN